MGLMEWNDAQRLHAAKHISRYVDHCKIQYQECKSKIRLKEWSEATDILKAVLNYDPSDLNSMSVSIDRYLLSSSIPPNQTYAWPREY